MWHGMPSLFFMLEGHVAIPVPSDRWELQPLDIRRVGMDLVGNVRVSTVFMGIDHGLGGRPVLFETMVFAVDDGDEDGDIGPELFTERYTTWDEAAAGHARVVAGLRASDVAEARNGDAEG